MLNWAFALLFAVFNYQLFRIEARRRPPEWENGFMVGMLFMWGVIPAIRSLLQIIGAWPE